LRQVSDVEPMRVLKRCCQVAAMFLCVTALVPVEAKGRDGKASRRPAAAAAVTESVVLSGIGRDAARDPMPRRDLRDTADGPTSGRAESRMLGRLPLHQRVDVGIGLFAVTGATVKEREFKRTDPIRDVAPRSSRLAGAGLRVHF
jgi:hypothetical protein